jgi:hypothetical protein
VNPEEDEAMRALNAASRSDAERVLFLQIFLNVQ